MQIIRDISEILNRTKDYGMGELFGEYTAQDKIEAIDRLITEYLNKQLTK